jgi:hypothetical protein
MLDDMPNDILLNIFSFLDFKILLVLLSVNKNINTLVHDKYLWKGHENITDTYNLSYKISDALAQIPKTHILNKRNIFVTACCPFKLYKNHVNGSVRLCGEYMIINHKIYNVHTKKLIKTLSPENKYTFSKRSNIYGIFKKVTIMAGVRWIHSRERLDLEVYDMFDNKLAYLTDFSVGYLEKFDNYILHFYITDGYNFISVFDINEKKYILYKNHIHCSEIITFNYPYIIFSYSKNKSFADDFDPLVGIKRKISQIKTNELAIMLTLDINTQIEKKCIIGGCHHITLCHGTIQNNIFFIMKTLDLQNVLCQFNLGFNKIIRKYELGTYGICSVEINEDMLAISDECELKMYRL